MAQSKVLVTDDEEDYGTIMKNYFSARGYDVKLAFTLQDCMENLRSFQPDILLLDNNLPDGQGWDAVAEIVEKNPHLRIFLVSAYRHDTDFSELSPKITIWEKPISIDILNKEFAPPTHP
jgi:DNA-binding response OmpR family regulator